MNTNLSRCHQVMKWAYPIGLLLAAVIAMSPTQAETVVHTGSSPDQTKPQIVAGPTVLSVTDRNALIYWTTSEIADSRVSYQQDGQSQLQVGGTIDQWVTEHFVVLSKLTASTGYSVTVQSQDAAGNLSDLSPAVSFLTVAAPDTSAPIVQGLPNIGVLTTTSAPISWSADEVSRGRIEYGVDETHLNRSSDQAGYGTNHAITLAGLKAGQTYYYRTVTTDSSGNVAQSNVYSFTTLSDGNATPSPSPSPTPTLTAQTISFDTIGDKALTESPVTLSATASSGLPVSFTSTTTSVCTVSDSAVTLLATGTCTIQASQEGDATYQAAPQQTQEFSVTKASQTISFASLANKAVDTDPFAIGATASSGLLVSFASTTPSICSINGSTVTLASTGVCTIQASQSGDAIYQAAPAQTQSFSVLTKPPQTITLANPGDQTFTTALIPLSPAASSGLPVKLQTKTPGVCDLRAGYRMKIMTVGICTIRATQAGNKRYGAAEPVEINFQVSKADQTITFSATTPTVKRVNSKPFLVHAKASSNLPVVFSGSSETVCRVTRQGKVTILAVGTCTVEAHQSGNGNYHEAPPSNVSILIQ